MIQARQLTKRFGGSVAVDALTFDVTPGIVTGFLGPNGSGKSTTMRMILGLDRPTSGSVSVAGRDYRDLSLPLREVGALLDAKAVHSKHTARAHLRWLAAAAALPRSRVDEVLAQVGLADVADRRTGGFSLGMLQRLGIAAALLGDPPVLILDEPVNGLDPDGIRWIRTMLRALAAEGRTILISSHLMSEMEHTADHVLVIGRGRLIADEPIREFLARQPGTTVRVLTPDADALRLALQHIGAGIERHGDGALLVTGPDAAAIGDLAAGLGLRLHELAPVRVSLETAFMASTGDSLDYRTGQPA